MPRASRLSAPGVLALLVLVGFGAGGCGAPAAHGMNSGGRPAPAGLELLYLGARLAPATGGGGRP
ncbi:MAG: hypothetical protein WD749_01710 [Phycisphaerales bacterium]